MCLFATGWKSHIILKLKILQDGKIKKAKLIETKNKNKTLNDTVTPSYNPSYFSCTDTFMHSKCDITRLKTTEIAKSYKSLSLANCPFVLFSTFTKLVHRKSHWKVIYHYWIGINLLSQAWAGLLRINGLFWGSANPSDTVNNRGYSLYVSVEKLLMSFPKMIYWSND